MSLNMSWNYRVMRTTDPDGTYDFAIHSVYYNDQAEGRPIDSWSEHSVGISGWDYQALTDDYQRYGEAFQKPVLAIERNELHDIGLMGDSHPCSTSRVTGSESASPGCSRQGTGEADSARPQIAAKP
jgi:hypothetical protein